MSSELRLTSYKKDITYVIITSNIFNILKGPNQIVVLGLLIFNLVKQIQPIYLDSSSFRQKTY